MPFRKTGDADSHFGMDLPNEAHQFAGVVEGSRDGILLVGQIASKGQNVVDTTLGVAVENGLYLIPVVTDAGQMGHHFHLGLSVKTGNQIVGSFSCGTAGAVSNSDVSRLEFTEFVDGPEEFVPALRRLGREKLKTYRRFPGYQKIFDQHVRSPFYLPTIPNAGHLVHLRLFYPDYVIIGLNRPAGIETIGQIFKYS